MSTADSLTDAVIEGEIEHVGEIVPVKAEIVETTAPITLFRTSDPGLALERMSELAQALMDVVKDRKLYARISGREHLTAEAWTTLGGMVGVVPVVTWTKPLEDGSGWEARVEARTLDGRVVGAAESMCSRSESIWAKRDEYTLARWRRRERSAGRSGRRSVRSSCWPGMRLPPPRRYPPTSRRRGNLTAARFLGNASPRPSRTRRSANCSPRSPSRTPTSTGSKSRAGSPAALATCSRAHLAAMLIEKLNETYEELAA